MGSGYILTSESSGTLPPLGIIQDTLLFPDVLLEDYDDNLSTHLYSIFQVLWNAGGWLDSPNQR
ncbi:MAG: hypothetical protein E4H14_03965 [Candidatus Thorarchaeota archaeon]|nr:MAG: hypothetical protein E4H14_03965 [Candidatus Thorarchaeota archaeon]